MDPGGNEHNQVEKEHRSDQAEKDPEKKARKPSPAMSVPFPSSHLRHSFPPGAKTCPFILPDWSPFFKSARNQSEKGDFSTFSDR